VFHNDRGSSTLQRRDSGALSERQAARRIRVAYSSINCDVIPESSTYGIDKRTVFRPGKDAGAVMRYVSAAIPLSIGVMKAKPDALRGPTMRSAPEGPPRGGYLTCSGARNRLARIGGDEFAILLDGVTQDHAAEVLRRAHHRLARDDSVDGGVACWDGIEPAVLQVRLAQ
jgi:hypothetical protein